MIRTICLAATASFATASAWAHSGHGTLIVDGHSHGTTITAIIVAVAIAAAAVAWIAQRYLQSR